jgi:hypothetical protein
MAMTGKDILIGLGIGVAGALVGAAIVIRRASTLTLLGEGLDGRVIALEGRVGVLEERADHGMELLAGFGSRIEVLERRRPQIEYVFHQVPQQVPMPQQAPQAMAPRPPAPRPVVPLLSAPDTRDDYNDMLARRFSRLELN